MDIIREKLKLLPDNPGVYIMLDSYGNVIYVGKAKVLKNRVRQYFHSSQKPEKVRRMVENIADFNYIITNSEIDALSLENNLIKKYKPKYNVLLKDDKTYPYIKITIRENFPIFSITRKIKNDGAKYFGPFMGGINCTDILETLQLLYKIRLCRVSIGVKAKKPCLNYHIDRCSAPCALIVSKEDYAIQVKKAINFLDGNYREGQILLQEKMISAAESENFELALNYKNKIAMLQKLESKRITAISRSLDLDVIGYATNHIYSTVSVLITRKGIMQGGANYTIEDMELTGGDNLTSFIVQYYSKHEIPQEIVTEGFCDTRLIQDYFKEKYGKNVSVITAKQGDKAKLLGMARVNAQEYLEKAIDKIRHKDDMTINACKRLQEILHLRRYPRRMECYDISNVSGVDKVGSMVVMIDGESARDEYRRFKIKTVEGANDFASLQEVLTRRLLKLGTEEEERFPKPDLIIIDGGKGQLSSVKAVFDSMGVTDIDLISLAEREEEVFTIHSNESIKIDHRDYVLRMLQRIRDEAHRFAITYFRNIHSKRNLASILSEIPGIGKAKRMALLERFGTIDKIMSATIQELSSVQGIGKELANNIKQFFDEQI